MKATSVDHHEGSVGIGQARPEVLNSLASAIRTHRVSHKVFLSPLSIFTNVSLWRSPGEKHSISGCLLIEKSNTHGELKYPS